MAVHLVPGLGSLSIVPREIRDLIYRHVFADKYCYQPQSDPIGLLAASKALRHDATDVLYFYSKFMFEFKSDPLGPSQELPGPSQEVILRLNHVEVVIHMDHYAFELAPGEIRNVDNFNKDIFSKLACTDRVRKTCRIICPDAGDLRVSWIRLPFSRDLQRLSAFNIVTLELEHVAWDFEDVGLVDRGPIELPNGYGDDWCRSAEHMMVVSTMEDQRKELRYHLEVALGDGRSYERRNFRCLEFRPQSMATMTSSHTVPKLRQKATPQATPQATFSPATATKAATKATRATTPAIKAASTRSSLPNTAVASASCATANSRISNHYGRSDQSTSRPFHGHTRAILSTTAQPRNPPVRNAICEPPGASRRTKRSHL